MYADDVSFKQQHSDTSLHNYTDQYYMQTSKRFRCSFHEKLYSRTLYSYTAQLSLGPRPSLHSQKKKTEEKCREGLGPRLCTAMKLYLYLM